MTDIRPQRPIRSIPFVSGNRASWIEKACKAGADALLAVRTECVADAGEIVRIGFGYFSAKRYRMEIMLERRITASPDS